MEQERDIIVVKIGGGAITDKSSPTPCLLSSVLEKLVLSIKEVCTKRRVVLVLGAGSFGHHRARMSKFSTKNSVLCTDESRKNAVDVKSEVLELCTLVERALAASGVSTMRFSPLSWNDEDVTVSTIPNVVKFLKAGFVCLFHGDVCLDNNSSLYIVSGGKRKKTKCLQT
jgi:isopentenyl phosphate kinase